MAHKSPTAIITGASSRIGTALARYLGSAGWNLVLHTHQNTEHLHALAKEIAQQNPEPVCLQTDLTDNTRYKSFMASAFEAFGTADILINNASIFEDDSIFSLTPEQFDSHMDIHTKAPTLLTRHFAENRTTSKTGLVINIIDQRVWKLTPQALSYTLSKSALWTATRVLAQALAPAIRVNAIGPGPSFRNPRQSEEEFARQKAAVLMRDGPSAQDFGRTVRFLWETPSITGQMIALDGGQHLAWQTPDVTGVGE